MNNKSPGRLLLSILTLCVIMGIISCSSPIPENFVIASVAGEVFVNGQRVYAGNTVPLYSQLSTNNSSFCILLSREIRLLVYGNTELELDGIQRKSFSIKLNNGIFDILASKSIPFTCITSSYHYDGKIRTARLITATDCGELWLKDGDGTIHLLPTNEAKHIDKNKKYIINGTDYYTMDLTSSENNEMMRVHFATQLEYTKNMHSDDYINNVIAPHAHYLLTRGNSNFKEIIQYQILEQQKGNLQKIILKNGKVIKGSARAMGKELEITTPSGIVHIPQYQVKHVLQYIPLEGE